jgi:thiamine pyrophosphate-dependent acetolactate synthase large subunit-like protein
MARAFGGHGERIEQPKDIIPAIQRGIAATKEGKASSAGIHTSKQTEVSRF